VADLGPTIDAAAVQPRRVSVDSTSTDEHPLPDLIEADRYGKLRTTRTWTFRGLMTAICGKMRNPGA
jgi:hypothetical protein